MTTIIIILLSLIPIWIVLCRWLRFSTAVLVIGLLLIILIPPVLGIIWVSKMIDVGRNVLLIQASRDGDLSLVKGCLDDGIDPNTEVGNSCPLEEAARCGKDQVAALLIARGADPNGTPGSHSPLVEAAKNGHIEIVRLLITSGADPNAKHASDEYTPLRSAEQNKHSDIVDLLKKSGALKK